MGQAGNSVDGIFAEGAKQAPYWWDAAAPRDAPAGPVPARADAVVIGSGYTGLHAALQIARGGRHVVVLEAGALGQGCSTRNGGQISTSVKPGLADLARRHGEATARAILADGIASRAFIESFVKDEGIKCDFRRCGRFFAAHSPRAYDALAAMARSQPKGLEVPISMVPRADQETEIGSTLYHGGAVFHDHASVDPGRYHAGLLDRVRDAGAELHAQTPATDLAAGKDGVTVTTPRGRIRARDVVLATNGYGGALSRWHQRRIIPIGSYIIATEPLAPGLMDRLNPRDRLFCDSRKVVYYYRASPDRSRILFGGRVSASETDTVSSARRLHREMARVFPELESCKISHSWMGFVGYTFDELAHIGQRDRVHHAMGYCGSGVGMASYLGAKTGLAVLERPEAATGLGASSFPTRPFYRGRPWFLPMAVEYHRLKDRLGM